MQADPIPAGWPVLLPCRWRGAGSAGAAARCSRGAARPGALAAGGARPTAAGAVPGHIGGGGCTGGRCMRVYRLVGGGRSRCVSSSRLVALVCQSAAPLLWLTRLQRAVVRPMHEPLCPPPSPALPARSHRRRLWFQRRRGSAGAALPGSRLRRWVAPGGVGCHLALPRPSGCPGPGGAGGAAGGGGGADRGQVPGAGQRLHRAVPGEEQRGGRGG